MSELKVLDNPTKIRCCGQSDNQTGVKAAMKN